MSWHMGLVVAAISRGGLPDRTLHGVWHRVANPAAAAATFV